MNKQETALIKQAMKAMEAEIAGSYGLGYPTARKANKGLLDALSQTGTTWTLIDWDNGKQQQVHPVQGFGESYVPETLTTNWQQGLWELCRAASKGKGIIANRIDYAARSRVTRLAALYKACLTALHGVRDLESWEIDQINGYLKAEWPTNNA